MNKITPPILDTRPIFFLKFFENIKNFCIKYPDKIKGTAKPNEYEKSNKIPLFRLSSVAAKTKIEPNMGPIQGVHPKAKAMPIKTGLKKFVLEFV